MPIILWLAYMVALFSGGLIYVSIFGGGFRADSLIIGLLFFSGSSVVIHHLNKQIPDGQDIEDLIDRTVPRE